MTFLHSEKLGSVRPRAALAAFAILGAWFGAASLPPALHAQDTAPEGRDAAADPAVAEITRAVLKARKDLDAAQAQIDKELKDLQDKIADGAKTAMALREEEKLLAEKIAALDKEAAGLEAKLAAAAASRARSMESIDAVRREIRSQAELLRERLDGSLATAQDEQIFQAAGSLRDAAHQAPGEQVTKLLEAYDRIIRYAQTAAFFQIPVRVPSAGGDRIANLKVLRLGLLGGYHSAEGRGGFIVADAERAAGFAAVNEGVSRARQKEIGQIFQKPDKGGVLPFDVTGGMAIGALKTHDTLTAWFLRGGFWMWPILLAAAAGAYVTVERGVRLLAASKVIGRQAERVVALLREGCKEAALTECAKRKDAVSAIVGIALAQREGGRERMEPAVQEVVVRTTRFLTARIGLLTVLAGVTPLLGLVGTAAGLSDIFRRSAVWGTGLASMGDGLAHALIATEASLIVAGACYLASALLRALGERARAKLEVGALSVMAAVARLEEAPLELEVGR